MAGFAFVDDADLIQTARNTSDPHALIRDAQEGLTLWEQLLRTTGGAIDPKKSEWAMLHYQWRGGIPEMVTTKAPHTISVRNKYNEVQPLKQIPPNRARDTRLLDIP